MVAFDWTSATLAGAFVTGLGFGVFVTLRVARLVLSLFEQRLRPRSRSSKRSSLRLRRSRPDDPDSTL